MNRPERVYKDSELLPLSAIQHLLFCERQCALIHIEQIWSENYFTAQGRNLHERVDKGGERSGKDVRTEYGVFLRSYQLGLIGKADVVEFYRIRCDTKTSWFPHPVEYKRGKPKDNDCDRIQLCAQAFCLEEQLGVNITSGAIFYGKIRRREKVIFDDLLREKTIKAAERLHSLISSGITPAPTLTAQCRTCSLRESCMPKLVHQKGSVENYINKTLDAT